jgi:hypothetical protein
MNYGDVKTYLRDLINRTDLTDTRASQFIQQAQDRLERLLRPSFLQRFVSFTLNGTSGDFRVPVDFLELCDLFTEEGELRRVDVTEWLRHDNGSGTPRVFIQTGHDLRVRPIPAADQTINLRYYGVEPELVTPTDENYWTTAAVDALVYAAASLAGDFYEDERLARFEEKFQSALGELKDQQFAEDFSGAMSLSPAYRFPED